MAFCMSHFGFDLCHEVKRRPAFRHALRLNSELMVSYLLSRPEVKPSHWPSLRQSSPEITTLVEQERASRRCQVDEAVLRALLQCVYVLDLAVEIYCFAYCSREPVSDARFRTAVRNVAKRLVRPVRRCTRRAAVVRQQ